jgi:thiosulfate/3-mercaptopyruvate sulfurtransferase
VSSPFVSAADLAVELAGNRPPHVFDATFVLHRPEFDGDYRGEPARERWREAHVPGSRYVDVSAQFSASAPSHYAHPAPQSIADELAALGVRAGDRVVVYDTAGTLWAARLWYLLRWIGVDVRVLDGGLQAWREAGSPVESGDFSAPTAAENWSASPVRAAWITLDELVTRSASDARPLVCGLSQGLFDGTETTRYSRRGHIPGSRNVPARALFTKDGRVRSDEEIATAHRDAGVPLDGVEVLLYCGGGISASAAALALAQIGVDDVRIYDESLEEWAADPALPLTTAA